MAKISKITIIASILLITNFQALQCSNPLSRWEMFIAFIFGDEQQLQDNIDQNINNLTIDNYIAQFRSDLNGHNGAIIIPLHEMEAMESTLRVELRNINLNNKDLANQKMRSAIIDQVKNGTTRDLDALKREGFYITSQDYQTIPHSNENNII